MKNNWKHLKIVYISIKKNKVSKIDEEIFKFSQELMDLTCCYKPKDKEIEYADKDKLKTDYLQQQMSGAF